MFVMSGVAIKVEIVSVGYCYSHFPKFPLTVWQAL